MPDAAGLAAAEALFQAVDGLTGDDLIVALLPAPPEGLTLDDEIELNRILLARGRRSR